MARISDLKLAYQIFMKAYPYRRVDWRPAARFSKPLRDARIAVVTTAGYFGAGPVPLRHLHSWRRLFVPHNPSGYRLENFAHRAQKRQRESKSVAHRTPLTAAALSRTKTWLFRWIG